jgi:uncharacterized protein (DUF1786 family)
MRILAVDVGTGTQDILLFDSDLEPENCFKLVMPSPTMKVARTVKAATRRGEPLLLTGVTMGGGAQRLGYPRSRPGWPSGLCYTGCGAQL